MMPGIENDDDLVNLFTYHAPFGNQTSRYGELRHGALQFARLVLECCPRSPERTLAIREIQQAVMMANASIALNEVPPQL
jgi:hypothetical protein